LFIGRPLGSFALCENEASATNVLSVRKRSDSNKCIICAKAKRQQQQMFYLCESEATATNVLSVRKRSDSNKCIICAKAKRQQQSAQSERISTPRYGNDPVSFYREITKSR